ncbi:MAG: DHH family phosphoesterase [Phycisphaerales bacterium]
MSNDNPYTSNTTYKAVARQIAQARSIALCSHQKPDGDALGSLLALRRALAVLGIDATVTLQGPLAGNLAGVIADDEEVHIIADASEVRDVPADLIIIADTGARSQLEMLLSWLDRNRDRCVILDHHVHGDFEAAWRIIDPTCAAAAQLILRLLDAMHVEVTGGPHSIAEALLLGIATDTGWFRYNNADATVFRDVARLLEAGADKSRLFSLVEENDRPSRLALLSRALASLEIHESGVALMTLRPADFTAAHARPEDSTGIVNEPLSIGSVRAAILLTEVEPGLTKISFRSKPANGTVSIHAGPIDVNRLAAVFGGGGHVHAAGARIKSDASGARSRILAAVSDLS